MKHVLLLIAAVLVSAQPAFASVLNVAWGNDCWSEQSAGNRNFACNTNDGTETITGSFVLDSDMPDFVGIEATMWLCANTTFVPDWWQVVNPGTCRTASLTTTADLSAAPPANCVDPWQGRAQGDIAGYTPVAGMPNGAELTVVFWATDAVGLTGGVEYAAFRVRIDHQKTTGAGACAGCATPAGLVLERIEVAEASDRFVPVDLPSQFQSDYVFWNGGTYWYCFKDPVRTSTWGQIKSLYR
jgi:hypothetical protein